MANVSGLRYRAAAGVLRLARPQAAIADEHADDARREQRHLPRVEHVEQRPDGIGGKEEPAPEIDERQQGNRQAHDEGHRQPAGCHRLCPARYKSITQPGGSGSSRKLTDSPRLRIQRHSHVGPDFETRVSLVR